jgi:single-strand DNA-binding protein
MAGEPITTIIGNLASDPDLKFLPSGAAVCNFVVASTPRVKKGDNYEDGEAMWVRCAVWRQQAENVAETLTKGTRVIVSGRLKVRSYEKDGVKRTSIEMDVDGVGPELRYATAKVNRVSRGGGDTSGGSDDAWTTPSSDEAPF